MANYVNSTSPAKTAIAPQPYLFICIDDTEVKVAPISPATERNLISFISHMKKLKPNAAMVLPRPISASKLLKMMKEADSDFEFEVCIERMAESKKALLSANQEIYFQFPHQVKNSLVNAYSYDVCEPNDFWSYVDAANKDRDFIFPRVRIRRKTFWEKHFQKNEFPRLICLED